MTETKLLPQMIHTPVGKMRKNNFNVENLSDD